MHTAKVHLSFFALSSVAVGKRCIHLSGSAYSFSSAEDKEIEDIIVRCMVNAGGVELYGKAPKGANEREAQALLDAMQ